MLFKCFCFHLLDQDTPIPVTLPGQTKIWRSKENELVYKVTLGESGNLEFSLPTNIIAPKGLGAVTVVS